MESLQEAHGMKKRVDITLLVRVEGMEVYGAHTLGTVQEPGKGIQFKVSRRDTTSVAMVGI